MCQWAIGSRFDALSTRSVSVAEGLLGGTHVFHERLQIADDPLRSVPVNRVAGLGVYLQGGTRNRCCEPLLVFAREEGILLPPQHQGRHIDLTKLDYIIMIDR